MGVCFSALMCHAPIVLPEVGGERSARCRDTTRAMREVAARVLAAKPDRVVLVSPHSPRHRRRMAAWEGRHRGDLGRFGAPEVSIDLPDAPEVGQGLGLPPISEGHGLDHGAMVPLAFLWQAGWRGPTALLALPWEEGEEEEVARGVSRMLGRTAVIASGDMSHRLKPGSPAGYHPKARLFDAGFVEGLEDHDWDAALRSPHRAEAAEDVVASTRFAMAAVPGPRQAEVLSYEGPFGVGYCEAVLYDPSPPLYAIARQALRAEVLGHGYQPPIDGPPAGGVFVTLTKRGQLRGCIGHVEPQTPSLFDEVAAVAPLAAVRDPRFPPVEPDELDELGIEVSVLEPAEDVAGLDDLDPRRFGVIVSHQGRRGLLLPDLDGVDTAAQQVAIARDKARIHPSEPIRLQRFGVRSEASPS